MKLKFEKINGYNVLVDEEIIAKPGQPYRGDIGGNLFLKKKGTIQAGSTIIFADSELNLDLPVIPDFEKFEVKQLAQQKWKNVHRTGVLGFIEGYNHNKAKYTEKDLRKAIEKSIYLKNGFDKEGYSFYKDNDEIKQEVLQSLQKLPKYIVVEHITEWFNKNRTWQPFPDAETKISRQIPKLITNSKGKQEPIIKEIIWN